MLKNLSRMMMGFGNPHRDLGFPYPFVESAPSDRDSPINRFLLLLRTSPLNSALVGCTDRHLRETFFDAWMRPVCLNLVDR